tara:strand:- start:388 stop:1392 length:1005 start_codon:yes stop_codon:yes gene_type:complete
MKKNKTLIIAEAGVNHNGSLDLAKKLIDVAYEAGADFIKFQTFKPEDLVTVDTQLASYQKVSSNELNQLSMLKRLELSTSALKEIYLYCNNVGIKFLSTPFDISSLEILDQFDMDFIKIASGEITNYPLLVEISKRNKPIICSTGMSNLEEIKDALNVLSSNGIDKKMIIVMQCNTQYPTPYHDTNLNVIRTFMNQFGTRVGFSDHTLGVEVSLAAVAMGACIIEKHLTTDNDLPGPDHKASLNPRQFKSLVKGIKNIEMAMGGIEKTKTRSEEENIDIVRKSIVAKVEIQKGQVFTEDNLTTKRPGTGLSPMNWEKIIGRKSKYFFKKDDFIK